MNKQIVGIDFGASNLKVIAYNGRKERVIKLNKLQSKGAEIPNVIYYGKDNEIKIGDRAEKELDNKNKISYIKRKLELKDWKCYIENINREKNAQEIASDIFTLLNNKIKENLSIEKFDSIITMPVCFSEVQKNRIKKAAISAGIDVKSIITEPFAALFSIEELFEDDGEKIVVIFDFGGSTLDLSLVKIIKDDEDIEVIELASVGLHYGGMDIDKGIYENILYPKYKDVIDKILSESKQDVITSKGLSVEFVNFVNMAKSLKENIFATDIDDDDEMEEQYLDSLGNFYEFGLTKQEIINMFEKLGLKEKIIEALDELFENSDEVNKEDVTIVKAFGGSSNIDYFRNILSDYFGEDIFDSEDWESEEVYTAIASGATRYFYAKELEEEYNFEIHNVIAFNIGIEENNRYIKYINRNEFYGFETLYRPLFIKELNKKQYLLSIYQSFEDIDGVDIDDERVIFMGNIKLTKELYSTSDVILFKMKMLEDSILKLSFYEQKENDDIVLIEDQFLSIGG